MKHKLVFVLSLVMVLSLLVACAPAEPQVVEVEKEVAVEKVVKETVVVEKEVAVEKVVKETVVVEKEVKETVVVEKVVEKVVEVTAEPQAAKPKGTLRVALSTFPNSLVIPETAERNADNAATGIYDSLVWIDENNQPVPRLAESWETSDDGTRPHSTCARASSSTTAKTSPQTTSSPPGNWVRVKSRPGPTNTRW